MINSPIFSVITICKDDLDGLRLTLDSLRPLASSIELILIVRCQPDLLGKYNQTISSFDCVRFIANQDSSLYNAMNIGLQQKSRHNPFIFMNAGDTLYAASVDLLAQSAQTIKPKNIFCFNTFNLKANVSASSVYESLIGQSVDSLQSSPLGEIRSRNGFWGHLVLRIFLFPCHQSILYGSSFETLRFDESLRISADIFFNSKAFRRASALRYFDEILCLYDGSGLSSTSSNVTRLRNRFLGFRRHPASLLDLRIIAGTFSLLLNIAKKFFTFH